MFWIAIAVLAAGAAWLASEAKHNSTRTPPSSGGDGAAPTGRTAHVSTSHGWLDVADKIARTLSSTVMKMFTTEFTGGQGMQQYEGAMSKLYQDTKKLKAEQFAAWINGASNTDVAAWGIAHAREWLKTLVSHQDKGKSGVPRKFYQLQLSLYDRLGVDRDALFSSDLRAAAHEALKVWLAIRGQGKAGQLNLHVLEAITLLFYGGEEARKLIAARWKLKPDRAEPDAWFLDTMAMLDGYAGAPVLLDAASSAGDAEPPDFVRAVIDKFTEQLVRNDIPPAGVGYDYTDRLHRITFFFLTPFRKERADEVLPSGTKWGAQMVYIRNRVAEE